MNTIPVNLEVDSRFGDTRPVVHLIWSGVMRIPTTHSLRCVCSSEDVAKKRVKNYLEKEKEYFEGEELDYWHETVWLDHLFGEKMLLKAREIRRKQRTGD